MTTMNNTGARRGGRRWLVIAAVGAMIVFVLVMMSRSAPDHNSSASTVGAPDTLAGAPGDAPGQAPLAR
ncbi:MAG: hypothetical protein ACXW3D_05880 [Caulobacteraceae bacterium]